MTKWRPTSASLASRQSTVSDWERAADVILEFQPVVVPGLLQSSGYAEAVLSGIQRRVLGDPDPESIILAAVAERVRRQQLLANVSKSFRFVLTERALRNEISAPVEMLAQIHRLRDSIARPNVTIGVIPDGIRLELAPMHGFVLLDDSMLIVDIFNSGILSRNGADVASYTRVFEVFEAQSEPPGPMLDKYEAYYLDRVRARHPAS